MSDQEKKDETHLDKVLPEYYIDKLIKKIKNILGFYSFDDFLFKLTRNELLQFRILFFVIIIILSALGAVGLYF